MAAIVQKYFVIPLSVQDEGEAYIVGNQELGEFYQFPKEGLAVINLLRSGVPVNEIKTRCAMDFAESIDVDDFIATLLEIGFISPAGQENDYLQKIAEKAPDRRWKFSMRQETAKLFVSPLTLCVYAAVVGYALLSAFRNPQLSINMNAFYLERHLTLTLVTLLFLQCGTTVLHELGHMIAAASRGIDSRLGIGNRLWHIVAEADLSGIFSLPKSQRYFPLFAGILVDIFSIAAITIIIKYLVESQSAPAAVQILQALILQILVTVSWQFNVFMRTDIYYALCNYYSYPNLDSDARTYIAGKLHTISLGVFGKSAGAASYYSKRILRLFALLWIIGRIAALVFLFGIVLPTLARYGMDAYNAVMGIGPPKYNKWDITMFVLISAALVSAGIGMWLFKKFKLFRGIGNASIES